MATTTTTRLRQGNLFASQNIAGTNAASSSPNGPVARPYKDFLTPALHRRFTNAALLTLAVCWAEATLMSPSQSWLWYWNPLGMTGFRTGLLFGPTLAVFIVRVMNMHVGKRTTTSALETVVQMSLEVRTVATVGWYVFSAWLFGEIYIWSRPANANLGWVDMGRSYERPKVNENPVLLRSILVVLAVVQAMLHLARDYDRVQLEETEAREGQEQEQSKPPQPLSLLAAHFQTIAGRVAKLAIPNIPLSLPIYYLLLRRPAWNYLAYPIAKVLIRQLPTNEGPTALTNIGGLFWHIGFSSALLVFLWELSNNIFTIYVSRLPLKKGRPLTDEIKDVRGMVLSRSKDPNGSLIKGLNAKKDVPHSFAFWELHLICTRFEARRKTLFAEVDRAGGSTWSQISTHCLSEITAISARIQKAQEPTDYQQKTSQADLQRQQQQGLVAQQPPPSYSLPKIAKQGVLNDREVVQRRAGRPDAIHTVGNLAKSIGQSPEQQNPMVQYSRQALTSAFNKAGGSEQFSRAGIQRTSEGYVLQFLRTPFGEPFRQSFAKRVRAVVLGIPHSNSVNIIHATRALVKLAVCSLKEDNFGQVAKDIPLIIRALTATIVSTRSFIASLQPHWTDTGFQEPRDRDVDGHAELGEVREILEVLRQGLEEVVLAFGEYASSLGLSAKELREAREVVGGGVRERVREV